MHEINRSDILDTVESRWLHRRPWWVGGTPDVKFGREERNEEDESDRTNKHDGGHQEEVAIEWRGQRRRGAINLKKERTNIV